MKTLHTVPQSLKSSFVFFNIIFQIGTVPIWANEADPNIVTAYVGNVAYTASIDPNLQVADVNAVSNPNTTKYTPIVMGNTLVVLSDPNVQSGGYSVSHGVKYGNDTTLNGSKAVGIIPETASERQLRIALADANETLSVQNGVYRGRDGNPFTPTDPKKVYYSGVDYDVDPNLTVGQMLDAYARRVAAGASCSFIGADGKATAITLENRIINCTLADPNLPAIEGVHTNDGLLGILRNILDANELDGVNTLPGLAKYINDHGFGQRQGKANYSRIDFSNGSSIDTVENGFKGEQTYTILARDKLGITRLALTLFGDKDNQVRAIIAQNPQEIDGAWIVSMYDNLQLNQLPKPAGVPSNYNWATYDFKLLNLNGIGAKLDYRTVCRGEMCGVPRNDVKQVLGEDNMLPYGIITVKNKSFSTNVKSFLRKEIFSGIDLKDSKVNSAHVIDANW